MSVKQELEVEVTNEYIQKILKNSPIKALAELIWNSLDADATRIDVMFSRNGLDGIELIKVIDNGHGIKSEDITFGFGKLGGSLKKSKAFTPDGRQYHGKLGQGRFSAFALGDNVNWKSTSVENGSYQSISITGDFQKLNSFQVISNKESNNNLSTGVEVVIDNLNTNRTDSLVNDKFVRNELSVILAPYLLGYKDIEIFIDGQILDPNEFIKEKHSFPLDATTEDGESVTGTLLIVEWNHGNLNNLYLCGENGVAYIEEGSGVKKSIFSHTVYLESNIIDELWQENFLELKERDIKYKTIREKSRELIDSLVRKLLAEEAADVIKNLRNNEIYPYEGEASTKIEEAERQVFDICAYEVNKYIPDFKNSSKQSQKFTYRLIKEALESNPSSVDKILKEVLNLTTENQDELANLLEKTSLASVINTTKMISDRVAFIIGLEEILYGEDYHKKLKERSQLHKILVQELWLFGEEYKYGCDDVSLKKVLKQHVQLLGRDNLSTEIDYKNITDLNDIPDICLWNQYIRGMDDQFENLVIELKRPSCVITEKEISQIKKYAFKVYDNRYFDKQKTKWKFILTGITIDEFARFEMSQSDRQPGLIYHNENLEVWVKEWNQIIQEAKGKHRYLKEKLELQVDDNDEGIKYLKNKFSELLPSTEE